MPVSAETYERVAIEDPGGAWELACGRLRCNPGMAFAHDRVILEIWRIRPYDRTVTTWRRQADRNYSAVIIERGTLRPMALPAVSFKLESLCVD